MSAASTAQKVIVLIAFILIGVPAGLCSILTTPLIIEMFVEVVKGEGWEAFVIGIIYVSLWLIGFAIAYFLMQHVATAFRNDTPRGPDANDPGATT